MPDQIGRARQVLPLQAAARTASNLLGHRKSRVLDVEREHLDVDQRGMGEQLADKCHPTIDMERRQERICRPVWKMPPAAQAIGHPRPDEVARQQRLDIADVVEQQGNNVVDPVVRRNRVTECLLAAEDLLAHQAHQQRVLAVVIRGIGARDVRDRGVDRIEHQLQSRRLVITERGFKMLPQQGLKATDQHSGGNGLLGLGRWINSRRRHVHAVGPRIELP